MTTPTPPHPMAEPAPEDVDVFDLNFQLVIAASCTHVYHHMPRDQYPPKKPADIYAFLAGHMLATQMSDQTQSALTEATKILERLADQQRETPNTPLSIDHIRTTARELKREVTEIDQIIANYRLPDDPSSSRTVQWHQHRYAMPAYLNTLSIIATIYVRTADPVAQHAIARQIAQMTVSAQSYIDHMEQNPPPHDFIRPHMINTQINDARDCMTQINHLAQIIDQS